MKYFAVVGNPIHHSISPRLHNNAFLALKEQSVYSRLLLPLDISASEFKERILALGLSGVNVTVPFKEIALSASDEIDEFAAGIGSVNTIILKNGKLCAFNTDAPGFMMAIADFKGIKNALILGAGGTARALSVALSKSGVSISILNRSASRAGVFGDYDFYTPDTFKTSAKYDIVVNTTPAGLSFDGLPFSLELLEPAMSGAKYAFDAVYGRKTAFIDLAQSRGLECRDGLLMLLYQAVLAFDIFSEKKYDLKDIEKYMSEALRLKF